VLPMPVLTTFLVLGLRRSETSTRIHKHVVRGVNTLQGQQGTVWDKRFGRPCMLHIIATRLCTHLHTGLLCCMHLWVPNTAMPM
jgi:hypothetical protein